MIISIYLVVTHFIRNIHRNILVILNSLSIRELKYHDLITINKEFEIFLEIFLLKEPINLINLKINECNELFGKWENKKELTVKEKKILFKEWENKNFEFKKLLDIINLKIIKLLNYIYGEQLIWGN